MPVGRIHPTSGTAAQLFYPFMKIKKYQHLVFLYRFYLVVLFIFRLLCVLYWTLNVLITYSLSCLIFLIEKIFFVALSPCFEWQISSCFLYRQNIFNSLIHLGNNKGTLSENANWFIHLGYANFFLQSVCPLKIGMQSRVFRLYCMIFPEWNQGFPEFKQNMKK